MLLLHPSHNSEEAVAGLGLLRAAWTESPEQGKGRLANLLLEEPCKLQDKRALAKAGEETNHVLVTPK